MWAPWQAYGSRIHTIKNQINERKMHCPVNCKVLCELPHWYTEIILLSWWSTSGLIIITVSICDLGYQSGLHGYYKIPGKLPEMEDFIESHYFRKFSAEEWATVRQNGIGRVWLFACLMTTMKENKTGRDPAQYTTFKRKVPVGLFIPPCCMSLKCHHIIKVARRYEANKLLGECANDLVSPHVCQLNLQYLSFGRHHKFKPKH